MKLEYLKNAISNSKYLVCIAGLNMTKEMGVPHYRDGIRAYEVEAEYGYSPEELYNAQVLSTRPELFYRYYRDEILSNIPEYSGAGFHALADLEQMGFLKSVITKGIYNLPRRAGIQRVYNLYGTIYDDNHCPRCGRIFTMEYIRSSRKPPLCEYCGIALHPGTTLLGEMVDNHIMSMAAEEITKADTLLLAGANLYMDDSREFMQYFDGNKVIIINKEPHYSDHIADLAYNETVEEMLPELVKMIKG